MAATTSQPIALPSASHDQPDSIRPSGSYANQINPASSLKYFMGSPMSWRTGSFGARFYPGLSPGQFLGHNDFAEYRKVSSSVESDRGSILNAFLDKEDELCRNYTCCGLNLSDLHALLEHFEECHVVVVDPYSQQQQAQLANNGKLPQPNYFTSDPSSSHGVDANANAHMSSYHYHQGPFDPDDMELDIDNNSNPSSGGSSPPDTPISTPLSAYPSPVTTSSTNPFSQPSSGCPSPISAFDTTTVLPSRSSLAAHSMFPSSAAVAARNAVGEEAFNSYAGYSEYSAAMPGTNGAAVESTGIQAASGASSGGNGKMRGPYQNDGCVPPALLFSASSTPLTTPATSRVGSPTPYNAACSSTMNAFNAASSAASTSSQTPRASTTLSRPASSLLLSKPFRCPKPNCNKSYKQANGLKYHMTHGSCNFGPAKELGEVQAVLREKVAGRDGEENRELTEREMMEVEREAERRLRPFACGVGDCQRRYKNMNGLRYHYQHSGDHGAIGLALLASGQHECLRNAHGRRERSQDSSRHSTPSASTVASPSPLHYSSTISPSQQSHQTTFSAYAPPHRPYPPQQQQQHQPWNGAMVMPYVLQHGHAYSG